MKAWIPRVAYCSELILLSIGTLRGLQSIAPAVLIGAAALRLGLALVRPARFALDRPWRLYVHGAALLSIVSIYYLLFPPTLTVPQEWISMPPAIRGMPRLDGR